jgi:hypothetical protein
VKRQILSLVRLPISPHPQAFLKWWGKGKKLSYKCKQGCPIFCLVYKIFYLFLNKVSFLFVYTIAMADRAKPK